MTSQATAYAVRDTDAMAGITEDVVTKYADQNELHAMCVQLTEALRYLLRNKKLTDRNVRYRNLLGEANALVERSLLGRSK